MESKKVYPRREKERYPGEIEELIQQIKDLEFQLKERGYKAAMDEVDAYQRGLKKGLES
jgi:hypothetical protein